MSRHRFVRGITKEALDDEDYFEDEYYDEENEEESYSKPARTAPAPKSVPQKQGKGAQSQPPSSTAKGGPPPTAKGKPTTKNNPPPTTTKTTTPSAKPPAQKGSTTNATANTPKATPTPKSSTSTTPTATVTSAPTTASTTTEVTPSKLTVEDSPAQPTPNPEHRLDPPAEQTEHPLSSASATEATVSTTTHNVSQHSSSRHDQLLKLLQTKQTDAKEAISLVTVGHVDAGKSTTMGHLLCLLGHVSAQTMHRYERDSAAVGKGSFAYAWVLDAHATERARGVTTDVAVTHLETPKHRVTLLDAPGHRDFVPNMISGASQADAALLVVHAGTGEFEAGFMGDGQTREHALLTRSLGITQLIVAVNQMDKVSWSKERYDQITTALTGFLRKAGFRDNAYKFVPISGLSGENLVKRVEPKLSAWYNGPTLVECIDQLNVSERARESPFRLSASDVYKVGSGICVGGKIDTGIVGVNDKLLILPSNELVTVKSIWSSQLQTEVSGAGENVDLTLHGAELTALSVGSVLCDPASRIPLVRRFIAQILTFTLDIPITNGMQAILYAHNLSASVTISRLCCIIDRATGTVTHKRPRALSEQVTAEVEISVDASVSLCLDEYSACKSLGRFTLRAAGKTIAGGVIKKILSTH
ncbi:Hsp70 subfamily B suppressor 1 [Pelomyxa schiedti]|nr:Hsp70 subfamily B suppressor 1 [Pelomyxa schiedti]